MESKEISALIEITDTHGPKDLDKRKSEWMIEKMTLIDSCKLILGRFGVEVMDNDVQSFLKSSIPLIVCDGGSESCEEFESIEGIKDQLKSEVRGLIDIKTKRKDFEKSKKEMEESKIELGRISLYGLRYKCDEIVL